MFLDRPVCLVVLLSGTQTDKVLVDIDLQHNWLLQASVFRRNRRCFGQLIYPVIRGRQQVRDVSVQRIFRDDGHFH